MYSIHSLRVGDLLGFVEDFIEWSAMFQGSSHAEMLKPTLDDIQLYVEGLFRMCPLQVGDRAAIAVDLKINKDSGWYSSRQDLKKGAQGRVREIDYRGDGFTCLFKPDVSTWIGDDFQVHTVEMGRPCFSFKVDQLKKID